MAIGAVTITSTATKILSANVERRSHFTINTSTTLTVYVGPDDTVTTANGYPLGPEMQMHEDRSEAGFWKGDIWGITASGSAEVRYWERTEKT